MVVIKIETKKEQTRRHRLTWIYGRDSTHCTYAHPFWIYNNIWIYHMYHGSDNDADVRLCILLLSHYCAHRCAPNTSPVNIFEFFSFWPFVDFYTLHNVLSYLDEHLCSPLFNSWCVVHLLWVIFGVRGGRRTTCARETNRHLVTRECAQCGIKCYESCGCVRCTTTG